MSVALRGNLKDFGIAEVFQLIGQQRKTGTLALARRGRRIEILFDRGSVVRAMPVGARPYQALGEMLMRCGALTVERADRLFSECEASALPFPVLAETRGGLPAAEVAQIEDLLTQETIFEVLRWTSGSFDFSSEPAEHDRPFETLLGAEQILMDGLRMGDEWQSFAEEVPSEDIVFRRTGSFDACAEALRLDPRDAERQLARARRVLDLVDGRLAVRRVIDLSRLGTFEATRTLADLRRAGVIEPLDPERVRRVAARQRKLALGRVSIRGGLAACVPMLLLSVGLVVAQPRSGSESLGAHPIRREPLEALRDAHAARRVRRGLDAYRFAEGRYPEALGALETREILEPGALASLSGRAYHYEVGDDGVVFLAPER